MLFGLVYPMPWQAGCKFSWRPVKTTEICEINIRDHDFGKEFKNEKHSLLIIHVFESPSVIAIKPDIILQDHGWPLNLNSARAWDRGLESLLEFRGLI